MENNNINIMRINMLDLFSLVLETILDFFASKFSFINNELVRSIIQIIVMISICILIIAVCFFIISIIKKVK